MEEKGKRDKRVRGGERERQQPQKAKQESK